MDYSTSCKYTIRLVEKLKSLDTQNVLDFEVINKAIYWARKYHGDQKRKSGEPFYSHPLEVAYMVSDYNLKTDVIVASILHDIIEDTEVTARMIQGTFGERIAEMVDRLTRDRPDGTKLSVEQVLNNAYHLKDKEVLLIKLFDRLHNIQTIGGLTVEKTEQIIKETVEQFFILALYLENIDTTQRLAEICYNNANIISVLQYRYLVPLEDSSQLLSQVFQNALNQIENLH